MINGVININKEKNMTSHDIVNIVRKKLGIKKVGHTGTLDPMATGVLPVCIGSATKIASNITDGDKTYSLEMELGYKTDTYDSTGKIIASSDKDVTYDEIRLAILSFKGKIRQVPPMYSAIKINGKKLYELAREGKTVDRKARNIEIYDIRDIKVNGRNISFEVLCSKGTYIRSLVFDIGEKLGTYACMTKLTRTMVGTNEFCIKDAMSISDFKNATIDEIVSKILPLDKFFDDYSELIISKKYDKYLYNGNKLPYDKKLYKNLDLQDSYNVYSEKKEYMGVYNFIYDKNFREYKLVPRYFFNLRKDI